MTELKIHSKQGIYPVYIGAGVLASSPIYFEKAHITQESPIVIVTDKNVQAAGYPAKMKSIFISAGYQVHILVVEPGDKSKSLDTCESLYNQLLDLKIRRNGVIVAIGGGVAGDLAGFVAATYERGIRFVQMPTTLLAHDSSIGGKVGINLPRGKNLVGAFYPPKLVLYDASCLQTLPEREWRNGMAEVIKEGLIANPSLLEQLNEKPLIQCPADNETVSLLENAMKVKIDIVEKDEHEAGLRMFLNLGHTIGHAIEQLSNYQIHHGEAVSIGICAEAKISVNRGLLTKEEALWITDLLQKHGLPTQLPNFAIDNILEKIQLDKKHQSQNWTFVLPKGIGKVILVNDVTPREVETACLQS